MNYRALFVRQLHAELPLWVAQGWISEAQALHLAGQYPLMRHDGRQGWQILLSVLAALCVGGGVIALFAANWHELSRPMRVVLSLAPLLLSQGAFLYARFRKAHSVAWRETAALLIALTVGASIALIAQTYHIESQGMFWRLWLWLVLPLPYVTGSWAAAFFAGFLAHVFGVSEMEIFAYGPLNMHLHWEYLVYLAALVPWLWWQAQRGKDYAGQDLVWRAFVNAQAMLAVSVLFILHGAEPFSALLFFAAAYVCCRACCGTSVMGMFFAFALAIAYLVLAETPREFDRVSFWHIVYAAPLLLAALSRWRKVTLWSWCFALCGVLLYLMREASPGTSFALWSWVITVAVVALGIWQLRLALDEERYLAINAAFIWVLAALYWRFVDADIPLWFKGVAFIVAGVALFALNRFVAKRHKGVQP